MTREQALAELKELQKSFEIDEAHLAADEVLCKLLSALGYQDVVDEWEKIDKHYD